MLLEEAYEAFEAVEEAREGRPNELRDELGDLLFQIIFYAQVAKEQNDFAIERRHQLNSREDGSPASTRLWRHERGRHGDGFAKLGSDEAGRAARCRQERAGRIAARWRVVKSPGVDGSTSTLDQGGASGLRLGKG